MTIRGLLLAATMLAAAGATPAGAVVLSAGPGTFVPDAFAAAPSGTVLSTVGPSTYTSNGGAGDFTGRYSVTAISDPLNVFGAGDVTLLYNFDVTGGANDIGRVTVSGFTAFSLVDAGFVTQGNVAPVSVDRSTAAPVGFNFAAGLGAGFISDELVVETPGRFVVPGEISFINTETSDNPGLSAGVPEPRTWMMMLAGFALLGVAGLVRKKGAISIA